MLLTSEQLLTYQRCERRAFLDVYGNLNQLDPLTDFHVKLHQNRSAHHKTILAKHHYQQPHYPSGNWQAGAEATLALMQQGVESIHRGVLLATATAVYGSPIQTSQGMISLAASAAIPEENGEIPSPSQAITLLSCPDLLVKQPGTSKFGDWQYVAADIQMGKRPKQEYQVTAAFHAEVLATVQGVPPETVWVMLRGEKGLYHVNLTRVLPQMRKILANCVGMLLLQQEPEVFISRQRCNLCRWYSSCYAIAQSQQHLSLLPGVSPSRYAHLQARNLTTIESLAGASPEQLETAIERDVAEQLVRQAQSVLQNQVIWHSSSSLMAETLPAATIELYFDIEAQPDLELDYLLGVLVVDRQAKTQIFHPFLAEHPADEGFIWQQFLGLVFSYPQAPIFHFCDYEVDTVRRLGKCYKTPSDEIRLLLERFVDIHERVRQAAILPIESYALKPIARWLGFEWRNPKANGQVCIYWYDQWLETGDRSFLNAILHYNEDDCRATYHLKDWLANQLCLNITP